MIDRDARGWPSNCKLPAAGPFTRSNGIVNLPAESSSLETLSEVTARLDCLVVWSSHDDSDQYLRL